MRGDAGSEPGLFVLWSNARAEQARILAVIRSQFDVRGVHEIHWSPQETARNFDRFYRGRLVPPYRGASQRLKGDGPLLVVIVVDHEPRYEPRDTLGGRRVVNANFFDTKLRFRTWTGGTTIHSSDSAAEATRDLMVLLGTDASSYLLQHPQPWDEVIRSHRRDLIGAHGWESMDGFFTALNHAVPYVVLPAESGGRPTDQGSGIEILTSAYKELVAVANARPVGGLLPPWGGRFRVRIGGSDLQMGFRFVGDGFLDASWERGLLQRRAWTAPGLYSLGPDDALETLAYRAVAHGAGSDESRRRHVAALARVLGRPLGSQEWADGRALVDELLRDRGYGWTRPRDPYVPIDPRALGSRWPLAEHIRVGLARSVRTLAGPGGVPVRAAWLMTRDRLSHHTPWLKQLPGMRNLVAQAPGRRGVAGQSGGGVSAALIAPLPPPDETRSIC